MFSPDVGNNVVMAAYPLKRTGGEISGVNTESMRIVGKKLIKESFQYLPVGSGFCAGYGGKDLRRTHHGFFNYPTTYLRSVFYNGAYSAISRW